MKHLQEPGFDPTAVTACQANRILISVVVPVLGRRKLLQNCLHALLRQSFDHRKFEIIVVDAAPSCATQRVVLDIAAQAPPAGPAIHYIGCRGPGGPAAARNCGWRVAAGELIAFTEPDTCADSDWLRAGFNALYQRAEAAWGRIVPPPFTRSGSGPHPLGKTTTSNDAAGVSTRFSSGNCFCTRSVLEALDGFDTCFKADWHADTDLLFRILERGAPVLHVQNALVERIPRVASWRTSVSQTRHILFDALLHKKHPYLYHKLICTTPCNRDYPIMLALLLTCGVFLTAAPLLAAGAGLAWLAMTCMLCGRRLAHSFWRVVDLPGVLVSAVMEPPLALFWRAVAALRFRPASA